MRSHYERKVLEDEILSIQMKVEPGLGWIEDRTDQVVFVLKHGVREMWTKYGQGWDVTSMWLRKPAKKVMESRRLPSSHRNPAAPELHQQHSSADSGDPPLIIGFL